MIGERPRVAVVGDVGLDVLAVPRGPVTADSDTRADVRLSHGGAGGNTAAWLVASGAEALLIARVGSDDAADLVRAELDRAGVQWSLGIDESRPTCCVVVVVDDAGRRTMLPDRGASAALSAEDVAAVELAGVDHLHLSGYVLLDPSSREAGLAALDRARRAGLTTSVDPQAAALLTDPDQFLRDVHGVDLLLPNEDELVALAGSTGTAAARRLLDSVAAVAFTAGVGGAAWVDHDNSLRLPAQPAVVVDPTGAGDAFDAGVLAAWLAGKPVEAALSSGVRAGAAAVSTHGARPARSW